jgi:predicted TIM-barrel fold metal-dependent hydrolase
MKIIDTHFHLWDLDANYYPWLNDGDRPSLIKDYSALRRNYLISDLLRDIGTLDVIAGVHIQAEHDPKDHVRETRWLQEVADLPGSRGMPQGIVANADFASADIERILAEHCAFPNIRGIRHALHRRLDEQPPYDPLADPVWTGNFPLLKKYGLSFDMQVFPSQAELAVDLIRRNPDVQFVLTHAAMPFWRDPENIARWHAAIKAYASCPNVAIKLSGFDGFDPTWSAESIDPIVSEVIEAFTPRRCMLGSNFPVEGLVKRYEEIWAVFFDYFSSFAEAEQEMLFWRNAKDIYRLGV